MVYRFSGTTAVVIVVPSLMIRTAPASKSSLLGREKVIFIGRTCFRTLAADLQREDELALVGVGRQRLVGIRDLVEQGAGLGSSRLASGSAS